MVNHVVFELWQSTFDSLTALQDITKTSVFFQGTVGYNLQESLALGGGCMGEGSTAELYDIRVPVRTPDLQASLHPRQSTVAGRPRFL